MEAIGAYFSDSLSLLGDSIAMSVDVVTYFTNIYAENMKTHVFRRQETLMITEVFVPSFSLVSLLSVTVYIAVDAAIRILHPPKIDDVKVSYMYGFAAANLIIDAICSGMFCCKGREVFYEPRSPIPLISLDTSIESDSDSEFGHLEEDLDSNFYHQSMKSGTSNIAKKNLNMISAFTHIGGDTIRTVAVLTAAIVSSAVGAEADTCDAWAALVVSVTIVALLVPLAIDIWNTAKGIYAMKAGAGYNPVPIKVAGGREEKP
jgi:Co/Zn/Cd efflux system component